MTALVRLTDGQVAALASLCGYASAGGHEDVGMDPARFALLDGAHAALGAPLPALAPGEWSALCAAIADSDSVNEDYCDDDGELGTAKRKERAARARALAKVRAALTTPRTLERAAR